MEEEVTNVQPDLLISNLLLKEIGGQMDVKIVDYQTRERKIHIQIPMTMNKDNESELGQSGSLQLNECSIFSSILGKLARPPKVKQLVTQIIN